MLFNTPEFVFVFLPITLAGFYACGRLGGIAAWNWLLAASLVFYSAWKAEFVLLLAGSIIVNYTFAALLRHERPPWVRAFSRQAVLIGGIATNLAVLGYFKYALFFAEILSDVTDIQVPLGEIALPVGISFYTFTQIAFLVDSYRGEAERVGLSRYALFVTYFPHLVAGPVLYHRDILPQFRDYVPRWPSLGALGAGLAMFGSGLYKKLIFADGVAPYANVLFQNPGDAPSFVAAWTGALAYTFQIYFDFSGYSDMAIGLSLLFGVRIPINFNSPYKATSIIDFWRRWHISLSRFLRDYLYIALGGNRLGRSRRYLNLTVTMLLGGLWHGAAWTFVVWGGLHGLFLIINHAWRYIRRQPSATPASGWVGRLMTFAAVVALWVPFRAESFGDAYAILSGMIGLNGIGSTWDMPALAWLMALLAVVWWTPNSQQLVAAWSPTFAAAFPAQSWAGARTLNIRWVLPIAASAAAVAFFALLLRSEVSPFIYYSF